MRNHFLFKYFSLPAVPTLSEVICMYTEIPSGSIEKYKEYLKDYGRIVPQAPAQITETFERPAAQLVKWNQVREDYKNRLEFVLIRRGVHETIGKHSLCMYYL